MGKSRHSLVLIAAMLLLPPATGVTQQVARVARIAEKKGVFVDSTSGAELWRSGGALRTHVRRADTLLVQDIVRLRERIIVDLQFRQSALETDVYLGSRQLSQVGNYEILRDSVGVVGGLTMVVKQGVMVIDHARGQLLALASGIRVQIFGTTVLFQVDPGEATGTVFLQEGHIGFPDYALDARGKDRAWRLQAGQPPVELQLTGQEVKRWRQEVKYSTQSVWQTKAFWQKPQFFVPAVAVVAGGLGCAAAGCFGGGDGGGTSSGGITVTIP
jgi:hypothetical protein